MRERIHTASPETSDAGTSRDANAQASHDRAAQARSRHQHAKRRPTEATVDTATREKKSKKMTAREMRNPAYEPTASASVNADAQQ